MDYKGQNIILIGMMGTGKSTVGAMLAEELGYSFVDLDAAIEAAEGMRIADMFEQQGESYFRQAETNTLRSLLSSEGRQVMATGGGCVLRGENCELMKQGGWVVALTATAEQIIERVSQHGHRPLLAGDAEQRVRAILEERKHAYHFAHETIDTTERTPEDITRIILSHYRV
ncbi:shikimate kinase [Paenibacillus pini]|uniref:Shikimate kinase n=1 Tax=Paenibacillus pini JCM 16418 TaxID=1236976 RepID=W7Y8A3_9BACL|nr:shikimate kinase [Paenibacillus pini]GAF07145.1 shikimate kinase I [Paenibacillus pini JCM 16418]